MIFPRDRKALMAVFCVAAALNGSTNNYGGVTAFLNKPSLVPRSSNVLASEMATAGVQPIASSTFSNGNSLFSFHSQTPARGSSPSALKMSADDFSQDKYTEAAWSAVSCLTKAADYYQASQVEAPLLLDILLNPSKHGASEDAESAQRVAKKVLEQAGVNVSELRSALETHLSKQPKVTGSTSGQKIMGRDLPKVLEASRTIQSMLGDSFVSTEGLLLALAKEDTQFTRDAIQKQDVKYQDVMNVVKKMREKSGPTISRSAENMYDALLKYGIDFTEQAKEGKLE